MSKHIVATVEEIPVGSHKIVEIKGRSIGVFNVNGEFFALLNRCPHAGGALCEGTVTGLRQAETPGNYSYQRQGEIVRCPWHGWEFDIKTGQSWFDPAKVRVKPYPVTVEADVPQFEAGGYQPGPYEAETFPVSVEAAYVVVEMGGGRRSPQ
ncbi:MAG: Rieske 2Fe-2S domain-containing protein [Chloroflexota bacterium]